MPQILYSDPNCDGSLDFWHVERLWNLAKALPINRVQVEALPGMDEVLWFGGPKNIQPTCRAVTEHARRIMAADLSVPLILSGRLCTTAQISDNVTTDPRSVV